MTRRRRLSAITLFFASVLFASAYPIHGAAREAQGRPNGGVPIVPPNAPAQIDIHDGRIVAIYAGQTIFEGTFAGNPAKLQTRSRVFRTGERIEQVVYLFGGGNPPLKLAGLIQGGAESFACEADRRDRRGAGPLIVRHVSGRSRSLLNRAVYDRSSDWALSVDAGPSAAVAPEGDAAGTFRLTASGNEIILRFRPRFYQKHRGLAFYEPWTYKPWPGSVAGWISWFAFYADITEKDVVETAAVFSEALKAYGYDYFQIDDGFQQIQGAPEKWLNPNVKFPKGLKYLVDVIKSHGLIPGLWTAASCLDEGLPAARPEWFVRDAAGKPVTGNWVGAVLDASIQAALDNIVTPLYKGLMAQGWRYIKLDALRHLRYEGYNANRDYFERKKVDPVAAFRQYVQTVRNTIGRDTFLLACWGIRPELIGLADACRIGDDGFAYAGLSQYNSFNNVVWRNDPDHIELDADGYRSTLVTTLTGSLMMLTDKPAVYRTAAIEPAKRTAPVLFTRPGQIFDVDPSRSDQIGRVDSEVSGSGPRPFDAGYTPACFLYSLEIERPFESWLVLGRTGGDFAEIRLADLGLDPAREYFVFEFWSKRLLGSFTGSFAPGPLDPKFRSQAFVIRERLPRPQLLATSRHITGGGVDLDDVRWDGSALTGKSRGVKGDPYVIYVTEPTGFVLDRADADGAKVERTEREGGIVKITLAPAANGPFSWTTRFSPR
ncbi:MAG: alpha-galactosidase [Candidatus Aminicenantes bacterium]|nr:alpha-galactosidase [Candidatus Aminicenantes bacterium]